jgi:phytanoyl-CoA hydroxylase
MLDINREQGQSALKSGILRISQETSLNALLRRIFGRRANVSVSDPLEDYFNHGWTVCRGVLDAELIEEARLHLDWLQRRNPTLRPEALGHTLITNDPFWVRLVADDALLDIAQLFVGPDIALFASAYLSKPPHDGQPVLWHQDGGYWPLDPMEVVTLWLAIDDATPENGCMQVVPGSHRSTLAPILPRTEVANALSSGMDENLVDKSKAVDVVLRAGDVSIHHPNIIHGSNANLSSRRRCGLTIRYIPTTTRILVGKNECFPSAFLLRGKPVSGVNNYNPWPRFNPAEHMPFRGCEKFAIPQ